MFVMRKHFVQRQEWVTGQKVIGRLHNDNTNRIREHAKYSPYCTKLLVLLQFLTVKQLYNCYVLPKNLIQYDFISKSDLHLNQKPRKSRFPLKVSDIPTVTRTDGYLLLQSSFATKKTRLLQGYLFIKYIWNYIYVFI